MVKLTKTVLILLLMSALPLSATAQKDKKESSLTQYDEAYVQVTLGSNLSRENETTPQLPNDLMERLTSQQNLSELELHSSGNMFEMRVEFLFSSLEVFQNWYKSKSTQDLFQKLENDNPSDLQFSVRVVRRSLAGMKNRN